MSYKSYKVQLTAVFTSITVIAVPLLVYNVDAAPATDRLNMQSERMGLDNEESVSANAKPSGICPPEISGICPPAPNQELQVRHVQPPSVIVPPDEVRQILATCAEDEVLTGGGWGRANPGIEVLSAGPSVDDPTHEWRISAINTGGLDAHSAHAIAICAKLVDVP